MNAASLSPSFPKFPRRKGAGLASPCGARSRSSLPAGRTPSSGPNIFACSRATVLARRSEKKPHRVRGASSKGGIVRGGHGKSWAALEGAGLAIPPATALPYLLLCALFSVSQEAACEHPSSLQQTSQKNKPSVTAFVPFSFFFFLASIPTFSL